VIPAFQTGAKEVRIAFIQSRLGGGEFAVIPLFSGRGDAREGSRSEERAPIQNAFLPKPAFRALTDAFEENEG